MIWLLKIVNLYFNNEYKQQSISILSYRLLIVQKGDLSTVIAIYINYICVHANFGHWLKDTHLQHT